MANKLYRQVGDAALPPNEAVYGDLVVLKGGNFGIIDENNTYKKINEADEKIAEHNLSIDAHPPLQAVQSEANGRIARLEDMLVNNINGNPYLITFGNLTGLTVTGTWNQTMARAEF